jgi:hypothetical protein
MKSHIKATLFASLAVLSASCAAPGSQQSTGSNPMTFFVTSVGTGKGAELGGLAGADRHCQSLAQAVGAGGRTWRAYLSNSPVGGAPAVNARDRLGRGPWQNAKGVVVARDVNELHGNNNLSKENSITEKGEGIPGVGDPVNMHDMLTGSSPDGRALPGDKDMTCGNWTRGGEGAAMVGHLDRRGLRDDEPSRSWNSSHPSRGCSQENLVATGGAGLLYCFAAN